MIENTETVCFQPRGMSLSAASGLQLEGLTSLHNHDSNQVWTLCKT